MLTYADYIDIIHHNNKRSLTETKRIVLVELKLYKSLIIVILLYGAEVWALTTSDESA